MSFLNEVLASAEEGDIHTLKNKVPIISTAIATCKQNLLKYIDDVYYKFSDYPKHNKELLDISSQLSTELNNLQQKIERVTIKEIEKHNIEINNLSEELEHSNTQLLFITRVIDIHELLLTIKSLNQEKSYFKAAHALTNLTELMGKIPQEEVSEIITLLKEKVEDERILMLNAAIEMFHDVIRIRSKVTNNVETKTIKIKKKCDSMTQLLEVLNTFNGYSQTLDYFCKILLEVCKGVIHNVTTIKHQEEGSYHVLVIGIKKTIVKCDHKEVFGKLTEIFEFLYSYFDYSFGDEYTTMRYFGNTMGSEFTDILIKDCLESVAPSNSTASGSYETIIENVVTFQEKLVEFNIFEYENAILQYAKNMDEALIEQKCSHYLAGAIALMKKDLHDSLEVGVNCEGNLLAPEQFPFSTISRSVIDILDLVRTLLEEAQEVSPQCAYQLICTAQNIFYQYGNIVHGHHERLLSTIPQQVALFRNNCLYIAHNLKQLNIEYSSKFQPEALPISPLFPDQGHQLQTIGGELFLGYIDDQVRLMEAMVEQHLPVEEISDKLNPEVEKLIRQCLRQYELLRTVWIKILPHSVYNKSMGYLFNAFCKKLIATVVSAPDIPNNNADQLVETFKVVVSRGPKLFSNSQEVGLYVENWSKLKDLVFMLGANLFAIDDMWAEGKGVLTLTFPAEEVRKLIKALFQNTDRRAAILNKIH